MPFKWLRINRPYYQQGKIAWVARRPSINSLKAVSHWSACAGLAPARYVIPDVTRTRSCGKQTPHPHPLGVRVRVRTRWKNFNFLLACGCGVINNFRLKLHYSSNSSEEYNVVLDNVIHVNCMCVSDVNTQRKQTKTHCFKLTLETRHHWMVVSTYTVLPAKEDICTR